MDDILPRTDDRDTAGFWKAALEERLVVQECDDCGHLRFPPHPYCPKCRCATHSWHQVSGYGRIWTYAIAHKPTASAFAARTPYPIGYIALEDHPSIRMTGNFVTGPEAEIDSVPHDQIKIGARVKVLFRKMAEDVALPLWTPTPEERLEV